jgi:hypothetical protein
MARGCDWQTRDNSRTGCDGCRTAAQTEGCLNHATSRTGQPQPDGCAEGRFRSKCARPRGRTAPARGIVGPVSGVRVGQATHANAVRFAQDELVHASSGMPVRLTYGLGGRILRSILFPIQRFDDEEEYRPRWRTERPALGWKQVRTVVGKDTSKNWRERIPPDSPYSHGIRDSIGIPKRTADCARYARRVERHCVVQAGWHRGTTPFRPCRQAGRKGLFFISSPTSPLAPLRHWREGRRQRSC